MYIVHNAKSSDVHIDHKVSGLFKFKVNNQQGFDLRIR